MLLMLLLLLLLLPLLLLPLLLLPLLLLPLLLVSFILRMFRQHTRREEGHRIKVSCVRELPSTPAERRNTCRNRRKGEVDSLSAWRPEAASSPPAFASYLLCSSTPPEMFCLPCPADCCTNQNVLLLLLLFSFLSNQCYSLPYALYIGVSDPSIMPVE